MSIQNSNLGLNLKNEVSLVKSINLEITQNTENTDEAKGTVNTANIGKSITYKAQVRIQPSTLERGNSWLQCYGNRNIQYINNRLGVGWNTQVGGAVTTDGFAEQTGALATLYALIFGTYDWLSGTSNR